MGACWPKPKNPEEQPIVNQNSEKQYYTTVDKPDTIIAIPSTDMKRALEEEQPREDPAKIPKQEILAPKPRQIYQPIKHEYSFIGPQAIVASESEVQKMQEEESKENLANCQALIKVSRLNINTKPWNIIRNGAITQLVSIVGLLGESQAGKSYVFQLLTESCPPSPFFGLSLRKVANNNIAVIDSPGFNNICRNQTLPSTEMTEELLKDFLLWCSHIILFVCDTLTRSTIERIQNLIASGIRLLVIVNDKQSADVHGLKPWKEIAKETFGPCAAESETALEFKTIEMYFLLNKNYSYGQAANKTTVEKMRHKLEQCEYKEPYNMVFSLQGFLRNYLPLYLIGSSEPQLTLHEIQFSQATHVPRLTGNSLDDDIEQLKGTVSEDNELIKISIEVPGEASIDNFRFEFADATHVLHWPAQNPLKIFSFTSAVPFHHPNADNFRRTLEHGILSFVLSKKVA